MLKEAEETLCSVVSFFRSFSPVSVNISLVHRSLLPGCVCLAMVIQWGQEPAAVHTECEIDEKLSILSEAYWQLICA